MVAVVIPLRPEPVVVEAALDRCAECDDQRGPFLHCARCGAAICQPCSIVLLAEQYDDAPELVADSLAVIEARTGRAPQIAHLCGWCIGVPGAA